uniref:Uncharacterized protein n=1 Tax=Laticauda laticaudata TaxID=8630 RepID=A0A8C5RMB4_LATLA
MSGSGVKCVTTPCVTSCPDAKVVVHPPPLVLTLPGLILTSYPNECLISIVVKVDSIECLMEKFSLTDLGQLLTLRVLFMMSSKTSPEDCIRL